MAFKKYTTQELLVIKNKEEKQNCILLKIVNAQQMYTMYNHFKFIKKVIEFYVGVK